MKIGELEQHCGTCDIIDFCGNSFGYCICTQERFDNVETEIYAKHAMNAKTELHEKCEKCEKVDCTGCDFADESRDYICEQAAKYVANIVLN